MLQSLCCWNVARKFAEEAKAEPDIMGIASHPSAFSGLRAPHAADASVLAAGASQLPEEGSTSLLGTALHRTMYTDVAWGSGAAQDTGGATSPGVVGLQLRQLVREVVLGDFLGAGHSGGKVFRATWRGSTVALKLMVSSDLDHLRVTTREALLSRSLSHPHLVQTFAIATAELSEQDLRPDAYTAAERRHRHNSQDGPGGAVAGMSTVANALLATTLLRSISLLDLDMRASVGEDAADGSQVQGFEESAGRAVEHMQRSTSEPPHNDLGGGKSMAAAGKGSVAAAEGVHPHPHARLQLQPPDDGLLQHQRAPAARPTQGPAGGPSRRILAHALSRMRGGGDDSGVSSGNSVRSISVPVTRVQQQQQQEAPAVHALQLTACPAVRPTAAAVAAAAAALATPADPLPPAHSPSTQSRLASNTALGRRSLPCLGEQCGGTIGGGGGGSGGISRATTGLGTAGSSSGTGLGGEPGRLLLEQLPTSALTADAVMAVEVGDAPEMSVAAGVAGEAPDARAAAEDARAAPQWPPVAQRERQLLQVSPYLQPCPPPRTQATLPVQLSPKRPSARHLSRGGTQDSMMEFGTACLDADSKDGDGDMSQRPHPADDGVSRFLEELSALGAAPGRYLTCVIMELCDRGTLLQHIQQQHAGRQQQQQLGEAGQEGRSSGSVPLLLLPRRRGLLPSLSHGWQHDVRISGTTTTVATHSSMGASTSSSCGPMAPSTDGATGSSGSTQQPLRGSGGGRTSGSGARDHASGSSSSPESLEQLENALEIAQAMAYLHSLDLVHGDLKPANVLLRAHCAPCDPATKSATAANLYTSGGADNTARTQQRLAEAAVSRGYCCKVADFGLTSSVASAEDPSKAACGWGAVAYLAPEVVTQGRHGKAADVYSYGAVLWQMTSGVPPHSELHPAQILVGLASGELQLEWPVGAEPTLRKIGAACLKRDPTARPGFEAIVAALLKAVKRTAAKLRRGALVGVAPAAAARHTASGSQRQQQQLLQLQQQLLQQPWVAGPPPSLQEQRELMRELEGTMQHQQQQQQQGQVQTQQHAWASDHTAPPMYCVPPGGFLLPHPGNAAPFGAAFPPSPLRPSPPAVGSCPLLVGRSGSEGGVGGV